jgi:hypothetical protein
LLLIAALIISIAIGACQRKPEDLEVWRPSAAKNGLEKLNEWISSPEELMPTRIRATEILLEEEFAYSVDLALDECTPADRETILAATVPLVTKWYETQDATIDTYQNNTSKQVLGKDGAFFLLKHVTKEDQKVGLEKLLIDWIGGEYHVRNQMGKIKLNQLADLLGVKVAEPLLSALKDKKNSQRELAKMLREMKDPKINKRVATTLVEMSQALLPDVHKDVDLQNAMMEETNEAVVPFFVKVVPDEAVDPEYRSVAIERIREIKGPASMGIYLKWVKTGSELLRWVSIQAIAESNGKAGLGPIFANLPLKGPYGGEDDPEGFKGEAERFCTEEVKKLMKNTEPVFINQLSKDKWPSKAISLCCLQFVGTNKARPAVKKLLKDKTPVPNWGEDVKTIGQLAKATLDKLPK